MSYSQSIHSAWSRTMTPLWAPGHATVLLAALQKNTSWHRYRLPWWTIELWRALAAAKQASAALQEQARSLVAAALACDSLVAFCMVGLLAVARSALDAVDVSRRADGAWVVVGAPPLKAALWQLAVVVGGCTVLGSRLGMPSVARGGAAS